MDHHMEDASIKHVAWLHSEQYYAAGDTFGEPQKTYRIGDEYQAQIPSLMTENKHLQLMALPICHDARTDIQSHFEFGLPIPVTWVHNQQKNKQDTLKTQASIQESAVGKCGILGSGTDSDLLPIPCSTGEESWSEMEHNSFVLGLYIFGKNLHVVNKFLGNKGMTDVLSYYYGKFYRSSQHKNWSMYRKKRSRKCVPGKNLFKGWRRQELLSRILPNVTDECKTHLTQVSSTFDEGKLTFENYVFTLRDAVGITLLVEAVAIGKEKQDLTIKTKKQLRSKKCPTTCSSFKTQEIIDILKDRIGLSPARLNELFWNVVWPRLSARGWHSEPTQNYALQNTENSLVFLAPGVAKFSRRGLEKGSQYFDSFSEVLNKVALEPQLLENEPNHDGFVQPHAKQGSANKLDLMKCTIVDTSLVVPIKVRELTSVPILQPADNDMQTSSTVSGETEHDTTEESQADGSPDCEANAVNKKMDLRSTGGQAVRKLKFTFKPKAKPYKSNTTKNDNFIGEEELMEDQRSEKKQQNIVVDLNNPLVGPVPGSDNPIWASKESVFTEATHNQRELSSAGDNGQIRQSTRNRPLTTKALEALANGFMNPKRKRRGLEDGAHRRVRAKTALLSRCGSRYNEKMVDIVLNGSSHMVNEYPK